MAWFKRADGSMAVKDDKDSVEDIEFKPEKLKEDITKEVTTKFTEFETKQQATLKPLLDMAASIAQDKKDREEAARKAAEKKAKEDNAITSEDIMLDPVEATKRLISEANTPIVTATKMMLAKSNLRDTMEGKPYYHGAIKSKVDAMVAAQNLDMQCRADVVENCYKAIVFDHMEEIKEGKIKAATSSMSFEGGGTGGHKADTSDTPETLTADETKAAAAMGISKDDWIKSRREMSFV